VSSGPVYQLRGIEVELGDRRVLGPLDLDITRGSFLGILGPNGSGKTTLLRALTGSARLSAGTAFLEGRPIRGIRALELARLVGVVPQQFSLDFGFTVAEMVAMGRYAHGGHRASRAGREETGDDAHALADDTAVATALEHTGVSSLAGRLVTELSGGERQRALIAQTLAQETPILLLDEPLNNLDLNHQLEVMQLLSRLHAAGRTISVVLHDLNMAAQYCDELALLDQGRLAARGGPADILDPKLILDVFRVRVAVHRQGRRPYLTPLWTRSREEPLGGERTRVHLIAGGGAAADLMEQLVLHGWTPTVGIVSVFDSDYATAQRYELEVTSTPPFQPFPAETVAQLGAQIGDADVVVVAPVYFGQGNLELLEVTLEAARSGKKVVLVDRPPIDERDLADGAATALVRRLLEAGATTVSGTREALDSVAGVDDTCR